MTTLTWAGGSGSWADPAEWSGGVAPIPDETELVDAGTVAVPAGGSLDAADVLLDGAASFVGSGTAFGHRFTLDAAAVTGAVLLADGSVGMSGTIEATAGTLAIEGETAGGKPGELMLLDGAQMYANGGTVVLTGTIANHATITVSAGSTFVNDGEVAQAEGAFEVEAGGTLAGDGAFAIGLYSSLYLQPGAAPSAQDVSFTDVGGRLLFGDPASFGGTIENFHAGDLIDLTDTLADSVAYDAASGLAVVQDGGATVATLDIYGPASGSLIATPDGSGGTLIEVEGTQTRVNYTIDAGDRAIGAEQVRSTMKTLAGAPIDGAGVVVGIISDNVGDTSAAVADGYLPTNGIDVLAGFGGSGDDEGLAMAEEVHQVAPGATLDFAAAGDSLESFASAVTALQQAGCQVIVDDVTDYDEPFFQDAGPLDAAIEAAVAGGVSYFAAAGNDADAAYSAAWTPGIERLYDGTPTEAELFAGGSPYQTLTLPAGVTTTIALQWAAQYPATGQTTPDLLSMQLYDGNGALVATSAGVGTAPEATLTFTPGTTAQYQLAITGALATGTVFKYVLFGSAGGGSIPGGTIDDPAADNAGTVIGHAMLPQVNAIGAIDFAETPAFGSPASYTDYYSASGPAALPTKPDLLAPTGEATSVFAPFNGTSAAAPNAAAVAALMLQADPALTPAQVSAMLVQSALALGLPGSVEGAGLVQAEGAVALALAAAACFAQGTRIATARGAVPVERLRRGDEVRLAGGGFAPVIWLGRRRIDCCAHKRPAAAWPVRIAAHAFAAGQPARDLWLSPDHAVFCDGALIPVRYLVNGATIARQAVARICYWHVELPAHAVLLAENVPAESYLDTGNRGAFDGEAGPAGQDAALARRCWRERGCAPLVTGGARLARVRAALLLRAQRLGHALTDAAALRVLADGRCLAPRRAGGVLQYALPRGVRTVRLLSRAFVPAEVRVAESDARRLGIAIAGLLMDGERLALDDSRFAAGWHAPEPQWRWTSGDATVAVAGARALAFRVAIRGRYWRNRVQAPPPAC